MRRLFTISVFWFSLEFCWQGLITIVLPARVLALAPGAMKDTAVAVLMSSGALVSVFAQPLFGTLSDYSASPWGKRRPFILAGGLMLLAALPGILLSTSFLSLFVTMLAVFVATDIAQGPYQGFIPDLVPRQRWGKASGFMSIATILGAIVGPATAGLLLDQGRLDLVVLSFGLAIAAGLLFTMVAVRETPHPNNKKPLREKFIRAFRPEFRANREFGWFLASRLATLLALTTVSLYFLYFIRDVTRVSRPELATGLALALAALAALAAVLPLATLSDRTGRKPVLYASGSLGAIAIIPLFFVKSYPQVLMVAVLFGFAYGGFSATHWAMTVDLVPKTEPAKFLGYTQFSTSAAQIGAPLLAGPLLDLAAPYGRIAYHLVFALALLYLLIGLGLLTRIKSVR